MYRIYTENSPELSLASLSKGNYRKNVIEILNARTTGYTVYDAEGAYNETPEKSLIVELILGPEHEKMVRDICIEICEANNQETVAMMYIPEYTEFITSRKDESDAGNAD